MASDQDIDSMAVVGHVADIVHAFKEALTYLKRIRERRKARSFPRGLVHDTKSLQDLEFSLTRGQDVVRSHYERDFRRLGQAYARGDAEAANQLKSILSELQTIVIVTLKSAYQHDQHADFLMLQDISDESQDRAVMSLMQLHQRVLMSGDPEDIATGKPYASVSKRPGSRSRNPPRTIPEERPMMPAPRQEPRSINSNDYRPRSRHVHSPITPELSPSQERTSFTYQQISEASQRSRPSALPINNRQIPFSNTLPSPPADRLSTSPSGPPPTVPLPPAPADWERIKRRHDELTAMKLEAERRAQGNEPQLESGRSYLDRTFARDPHAGNSNDPWEGRSPQASRYEFPEPHPGTRIDPSRIDEPQPEYDQSSPHSVSSADISLFPRPRTAARNTPPATNYHLVPPRSRGRDASLGSPIERLEHADSLSAHSNRLSTISTATFSSHTSGSSSASALSRATTSSSNSSMHSIPPIPSIPTMNPMRKKSTARVPEPIYESPSPAESQTTLGLGDARRPSAPEWMQSGGSSTTLGSFPPMPPVPAEAARNVDNRRASAYSQQSATSSNSGMPAPPPVRTIPAQITNASNSKLYMPTEGNKFGGLCKGAWRAQTGDFKKAYQIQQRPGGLASNRMVDFMGCKHCNFQGKTAFDAMGRKGPDRKIITAKDTGLEYRWDFLFKSHLTLKSGSSADAEYGCMFCCASGKGTPVLKSMSAFIAHTAEHRPGAAGNGNDCEVPDSMVCDRMDAIIGRSMAAEERFEVALPVAPDLLSP